MGNWKPREYVPTTDEIFEANIEEAEQVDPFIGKKLKTVDQMIEDDPDLEDDEYL
jgi:hypothetical protein